MKIKSLTLENFRRFEQLNIDFNNEKKLTVLVAQNSQGKTSILDAVTMILGTFIGAFDGGKSKHISHNDARYHSNVNSAENEQLFPVKITATLESASDEPIEIKRTLNGRKNKTTIKDAASLTNYGRELMNCVQRLDSVELPVMAYYGSGRLWNTHKNTTKKSILSGSRTMGYEDCFTSASSFVQVQQWMQKATLATIQDQSNAIDSVKNQIANISSSVDNILLKEGWHNFHYSILHEQLVMENKETGVKLPVSMLSDGVRAMVSLIADLSWRCAKLNPHLGKEASEKTDGIVLIDEVDMHLHPQWQQTVISSLTTAFPNIQFIMTTHSPQVLSTVTKDTIRIIDNKTNTPKAPASQTKATANNFVMAGVQGVPPIPDTKEASWIKEYREKIQNNTHTDSKGNDLRKKILDHFGTDHNEWQECEQLIRFCEIGRKIKNAERENNEKT